MIGSFLSRHFQNDLVYYPTILFGSGLVIYAAFFEDHDKSKIRELRNVVERQIKKSRKVASQDAFMAWKQETLRVVRDLVKPNPAMWHGGWAAAFEQGRYAAFDPAYNPCTWYHPDPKEAARLVLIPHLFILEKMLEKVTPEDLI